MSSTSFIAAMMVGAGAFLLITGIEGWSLGTVRDLSLKDIVPF